MLRLLHPTALVASRLETLRGARLRLDRAAAAAMEPARAAIRMQREKLDALSPQRVLDRGYAIVRDGEGRVLTSARQAMESDMVHIRFAQGEALAVMTEAKENLG